MYNRLKEFRKSVGCTQQSFADRIGISKSAIESYEYGRREVSDRTISDICRAFPELNPEWLKYGTGEMKMALTKNQQILSFVNNVASLDDSTFKKRLVKALSEMSDEGWDALEKFIDSMNEK